MQQLLKNRDLYVLPPLLTEGKGFCWEAVLQRQIPFQRMSQQAHDL